MATRHDSKDSRKRLEQKIAYAAQLLGGRPPTPELLARLMEASEHPERLRSALLRAPEICQTNPTLRIARYIEALQHAYDDGPPRLVLGASYLDLPGWIPSDVEVLNLLKPTSFDLWFEPNTIHAILAEHVWEHLSLEEGVEAARTCFEYLRPGGHLRIAVPDGNFPDPTYIRNVRAGVDGHQVLYTDQSLEKVLTEAGFEVRFLEWFDRNAEFHQNYWSSAQGPIRRSRAHDPRNTPTQIGYTSLIVDATKPAIEEIPTGLVIGSATTPSGDWQTVPMDEFLHTAVDDLRVEFARHGKVTEIASNYLTEQPEPLARRWFIQRVFDLLEEGGVAHLAVASPTNETSTTVASGRAEKEEIVALLHELAQIPLSITVEQETDRNTHGEYTDDDSGPADRTADGNRRPVIVPNGPLILRIETRRP